MAGIRFFVDASGIAEAFTGFQAEVEQDIAAAVKGLAVQTHALVVQKAQEELHSTREKYLKALTFEEVAPGVWVIALDQPALFIEEGLPPNFDMKPGLLKNAKTSKDGVQYKVIPFDHAIAPSRQTLNQQMVTDIIKQGIKGINKKLPKTTPAGEPIPKIPFKGIEKDANGSPRIGKLHSNLDLGGPVMGRGSTPVAKGVNIYQSKMPNGSTRRDILTFRTVTSEQTDKFIHPGLDAKKFMDKAYEEALQIWETQILPEITKRWTVA